MDRFYNEEPENEKPFFESQDNYEEMDDDDDDDDDDIYDLEEDTISLMQNQSLIDIMQLNLDRKKFKYTLIKKSIQIAKQNWFWRFKNASSKIQEIAIIFKTLMLLHEDVIIEQKDTTIKEDPEDKK